MGGDCECFCTAVAAYAQACNEANVCVAWRTPEICRKSHFHSGFECIFHKRKMRFHVFISNMHCESQHNTLCIFFFSQLCFAIITTAQKNASGTTTRVTHHATRPVYILKELVPTLYPISKVRGGKRRFDGHTGSKTV